MTYQDVPLWKDFIRGAFQFLIKWKSLSNSNPKFNSAFVYHEKYSELTLSFRARDRFCGNPAAYAT
jgi:hypothetical protein